jgi:hydroxymethylbilane synthase
MQRIVIASRASRLARVQAEWVGHLLQQHCGPLDVEYLWRKSEGDKRVDASLADEGGKGLFAKAIEEAVLDGEAHIAVHSMKDLPAIDPEGLRVGAVPKREAIHDCLISPKATSVEGLPQGAKIGTSSPRRRAQLLRMRPDLDIGPIRGNVDTRIAKVQEGGDFDATILALAGLRRLGLASQFEDSTIDLTEMLPAAGQGALAVQCRARDRDMIELLDSINDRQAFAAASMERKLVAELGCDCYSPVAVYVQSLDGGTQLRAQVRVLSLDGTQCIEAYHHAPMGDAGQMAVRMVDELKSKGSDAILSGDSQRH